MSIENESGNFAKPVLGAVLLTKIDKMKTTTQELIERIKTVDNIRSLNTWLKKNEKRLIEQDRELLKDAAIQAQREYINAGECYPPQFVVDRANNVVNELVS